MARLKNKVGTKNSVCVTNFPTKRAPKCSRNFRTFTLWVRANPQVSLQNIKKDLPTSLCSCAGRKEKSKAYLKSRDGETTIKIQFSLLRGGGVDALNRCHLSNWRFNLETVHFLSSKRPFCRPCLSPNATKTKHFGQDSLFSQEAKTWKVKSLFLQC